MPVSRVTTNISGQTWLSGAGAPASTLGYATQYYLDTASGNVYQKTNATTWVVRGDIVAPIVEGVWHSGSGAPDGSLGSEQDFYLDEDTGEIYEKTAPAAWTLRGDITPAPSGFFVLPDGAVLTGTYDGSVVVNGNATYNNTVVKGDLRLSGSLTPVNPTSTIEVGGDFRANAAYFGDNTRAAVSPIIKGDIAVESILNIYGNSIFTAKSITQMNALGILKLNCETEIYGDIIAAGQVVLTEINGGRSLICGGDFLCNNDVNGAGFDAPFRLGGVNLSVSGNFRSQNLNLAALANGGGSGGNLYCSGDVSLLAFSSNGADNATGAGGDGGTLSVKGNMECSSVALYGGQGLSGGAGGTLNVRGDFQCTGNVQKYGGAATATQGGYSNSFICGGNAVAGTLNCYGGNGASGGIGGSIDVRGSLTLDSGANTDGGDGSFGSGANAGTITVDGDFVTGGPITSEGGTGTGAQSGNGGNITVGGNIKTVGDATTTTPFITTQGGAFAGTGSGVFTSGNGGNILVGKSLVAICYSASGAAKVNGILTKSQGVSGGSGVTTFSSGNGGYIKVGENLMAYDVQTNGVISGLRINTSSAVPETLMGGDGATGGNAGLISVGGDLLCGEVYALGCGASLCAAGAGGDLNVVGDAKTKHIYIFSGSDNFANPISPTTYQKGGSISIGGNLNCDTNNINVSGSISGNFSCFDVFCGTFTQESYSSGNHSGTFTAYGDAVTRSFSQKGAPNTGVGSGGDASAVEVFGNFRLRQGIARLGGDAVNGSGGNVAALTVHGNLTVELSLNFTGGNAGTSGSGGAVNLGYVFGNAVFRTTCTFRGGNGTGNGSGGAASGINYFGNVSGQTFNITGGNGSGLGSGGQAAFGSVQGNLYAYTLNFTGGAGGASNSGGAAGYCTVYGNIEIQSNYIATGGAGGGAGAFGGGAGVPTVYGNVDINTMTLTGGTGGAGGSGAGNVGSAYFRGSVNGGTWTMTGGSSSSGTGGTVFQHSYTGPVKISNLNLTGGASTAGNGGEVQAVSFYNAFRGNISMTGGNTTVGNGGKVGVLYLYSGGNEVANLTYRSGNGSVNAGILEGIQVYGGNYNNLTMTDGTGTIPSTTTILIAGTVTIGQLTSPNRGSMYILHSNQYSVLFRVRSLVGRTVFRNANSTDTADQAALYANRIYSNSSLTWQYVGTAAA